MDADVQRSRGWFAMRNGREVFDNGLLRRWRCPVCAWWRDWEDERCCGCGLARDQPVGASARHKTAGAGS